jgi:hypothetical protein
MMEEKTKVIEKIVTQLHQGNFNPCIKSTMPTPDREQAHPLEMSCIPFVGSPSQPRGGPASSDNVFLDTPELVCASKFTLYNLVISCVMILECQNESIYILN